MARAYRVIARYDLSRQIAGFDFFHWLLWVQSIGATEIVIDDRAPKTDKWDAATVRRRIETIIKPGAALAGLPSRTGTDGDVYPGYLAELLKSARAGNPIRRLRSVLAPVTRNGRYTVTLRNTARVPVRNSNESAWRAFAAEIGALVIEDSEVRAMPLHDLMAIYASYEMNFGVANGPITMCALSDYPVMVFDLQKSAGPLANLGMAFGDQLPWATKDQLQVWEPDDLPVIRRQFGEWRELPRRASRTRGRIRMSLSENISIDDERDIITVYGVPMSGELLRAVVEQTPPGIWYRTEVQDGVAKVHQRRELK